jgi:hypothetical protein
MTQRLKDRGRLKPSNTVLFGLAILFVGLAILTLLPFTAPRANDLSYMSMCPFAPWSTLALLLIAGVIWAVRQYLVTRAE